MIKRFEVMWWIARHRGCGSFRGGAPVTEAPISQASLNLIVNCEVTGEGAYERLYTHLTYPGGASGATGTSDSQQAVVSAEAESAPAGSPSPGPATPKP